MLPKSKSHSKRSHVAETLFAPSRDDQVVLLGTVEPQPPSGHSKQMSADTTAHFIFVARNSFTEVSDIVVQYVICFSRSISSAKRFAWKILVATLAQYRAVSALTLFANSNGHL